ncbi:MAG: tRNA (adenosine(37)-N6)-threonylcarbamoyltransferase complex transferase subunit TsaD, partial [Verrucomicrobiota bacterium]
MTEASGELVLAIETSCDETAVAVCDGEGRIIASQVASQVLLHAPYGGVVPELASRNHNRDLKPLILATLAESNLRWSDLGVVAATSGPGLASSL